MFRSLLLVTMLLIGTWSKVDASHFRGGTVSWKYIGPVNGTSQEQIEVNYHFGWRLNSNSPQCSYTAIQNEVSGYRQGSWSLGGSISSYTKTNITTEIICTAFDTSSNWAYGFNRYTSNVTASGPFYVRYQGFAWISALYAGGAWSLPTTVDLSVRSDTGTVNNPPRTLSRPIVTLTKGCAEEIVINYLDDDNDIVRCRYAGSDPSAPVDECGSACNGPGNTGYTFFSLNETTCTITYNGGGNSQEIAVSLMLEDYPRSNIILNGTRSVSTSESLSRIPLQFIAKVSTSSTCNVVPTYPNNTIQNGEIVSVPSGGSLNTTVSGYPSSSTYTITQFVVIGPLGLQTTPAAHIGSNLYESVITWTPSSSQSGNFTVCYYAVDSGGKNGKQICFTISVTALRDPCTINNGGCSDICTPSGPLGLIPICSCSESCWSLQRDGKTCSPHMNVTCDGHGMHVYVAKCASNRTVVAGPSYQHITQRQCKSSLVGNTHYMSMSAIDCGIKLQSNPVQVQYNTHLWVWDAIDTGSSVITRGHYRIVPAACSLPMSSNLTGSFVPQLPFNNETVPVDIVVEGIGSFSLYFQFYLGASYQNPLSPADYPLQVQVNDLMHFSLGAFGRPGFVFFTEECVASSPTPTELLTYTFIRDGCFLDPTLKRYASNNTMEDRFSMQAFEFEKYLASNRQNIEISIQCNVRICAANDNSSRCAQGCSPSGSRGKRSIYQRVKRDVEGDDDEIAQALPTLSETPPQEVKARFLLLRDIDTPEPPTSGFPSYTNWLLIGIGGALLLIALFVAQRVLRNRRVESQRTPFDRDIPFYENKIPIDTEA